MVENFESNSLSAEQQEKLEEFSREIKLLIGNLDLEGISDGMVDVYKAIGEFSKNNPDISVTEINAMVGKLYDEKLGPAA